jgi:UDP-2,3-diacylglucosamine pyrophosphatase LpxH
MPRSFRYDVCFAPTIIAKRGVCLCMAALVSLHDVNPANTALTERDSAQTIVCGHIHLFSGICKI